MKTCLYYFTFLLFAFSAYAVPNIEEDAYAICLNHRNVGDTVITTYPPQYSYNFDKGFEKCHAIIEAVDKEREKENKPFIEKQRQRELNAVAAGASNLGIK